MLGVEIEADSAQTGHAAQETVSGQSFIDAQDHLLQSHGVHVRCDECHIRADRANIGNMVVQPLQFEAKRAQSAGPRRSLDTTGAFNRVAVSCRMRETCITGNALHQAHAMGHRQAFEQFLSALVNVEHPQLQIEDWFARNTEQEMARLNNAGVHWADRYLENAFAFDLAEFVPHTGEGRQFRAEVEILSQWVNLRPVIVQDATAWIGVAHQLDAEQILDFALLPVDGVDRICQ